jgi:hypothetical protein
LFFSPKIERREESQKWVLLTIAYANPDPSSTASEKERNLELVDRGRASEVKTHLKNGD